MTNFLPYGFIYETENLQSGKKYIGQRTYRTKGWDTYLGSGKLLKKAIKRYGLASFRRTIIFEAFDKASLDAAEREIIADRNAVVDSAYYNLVAGGHGCSGGFSGKKHSAETRGKMRKAAMGHPVADHVRKIVADNARRGHAKSTATRVARGSQKGSKHFASIPVTIDGVYYETMTEARANGYTRKEFFQAVAGTYKSIPISINGKTYSSLAFAQKEYGIGRPALQLLVDHETKFWLKEHRLSQSFI